MSISPARDLLCHELLNREPLNREQPWLTLTDHNFNCEVLQAEGPVLVDCWATWCTPQRPAHPILKALANKFADRIIIGRLNIANSARLTARYGIRAVPTLLIFNCGQVVHRTIGAPSEEAIARYITPLLSTHTSSQQIVSYL